MRFPGSLQHRNARFDVLDHDGLSGMTQDALRRADARGGRHLFPVLGADVRVRDLSIQHVREFAGDSIHVLGPRTGEFVDQAQMRRGVRESLLIIK